MRQFVIESDAKNIFEFEKLFCENENSRGISLAIIPCIANIKPSARMN